MAGWQNGEDQKQTPARGELYRQAAVVLFLALGALLQRAGQQGLATAAFAAAVIAAVAWIVYSRKQKAKAAEQDEDKTE